MLLTPCGKTALYSRRGPNQRPSGQHIVEQGITSRCTWIARSLRGLRCARRWAAARRWGRDTSLLNGIRKLRRCPLSGARKIFAEGKYYAFDPLRTSATWAVARFVRHGNERLFFSYLRSEPGLHSANTGGGRLFPKTVGSYVCPIHGFDQSAQCDHYSIERATRFSGKASFQPEVSAMKISHRIFAGVSLLALSYTSALAQQATGVPGSPSATTTITGKH